MREKVVVALSEHSNLTYNNNDKQNKFVRVNLVQWLVHDTEQLLKISFSNLYTR